MGEVRWGIVGSTGWSHATFAPAIRAADGARLTAVLSSRPERAEAFRVEHEADAGFSDLDAFLASDVDAVWIASPIALHPEHVVAALRAGKHVLCEKPMALSVADCEKMCEAAEASGALLSIAYHMRHHPDHRTLVEEWQRGDYGEPAAARAHLFYAYPELPPAWRLSRATSGGWALGDIGTHMIDLLRWALGDVEDVHAALGNPRFGLEVEDLAILTLRFQSGAIGLAEASTGAGSAGARFELFGTEGFCVAENTAFGNAMGPSGGRILRSRGGDLAVSDAAEANPYKLQVEAFGRAVRGEETLRISARDGLENIRILERARGW